MTTETNDHRSFVLAPQAQLAAVGAFPPELRRRLGGSSEDYVLSVRRSRLSSQRVDADTARFLQRFSEPRRLVDAVFEHASELGVDPLSLLEPAYTLVVGLRKVGVLIDPDSLAAPASSLTPRFAAGDVIAGARIDRCVHDLADTEIYRATHSTAAVVALKYVKEEAPEYVRLALRNEAAILSRLAAQAPGMAPQLVEYELDGPTPYLVMEWCEGRTVRDVARDVRIGVQARADMVASLARAYAHLHDTHILHGDVHPLNVLVHGDVVRLVDFGGARALDATAPLPRLGLLEHYEPEIVDAALHGQPVAPATSLGEQHNVAALAYFLLTGTPYLRLSLEREAALQQIRDGAPRPFSDTHLVWPELERVLGRALAKDPQQRYPTFAGFATDLAAAISRTRPAATAPARPSPARWQHTDDETTLRGQYGLRSPLLRTGLRQGPTASLFHGAAGIAYALLRLGCLTGNAEDLAAGDVWVTRAITQVTSRLAFVGPEIGLQAGMVRDDSVFHGAPGLHVIAALIHHASGRSSRAAGAIRAFLETVRVGAGPSAAPADATNGPASHLFGAALLLPACAAAGDAALLRDLRTLGASATAYTEAQVRRSIDHGTLLGVAHGHAGNLYALIRWALENGAPPPMIIQTALDELASTSVRSESGRAWPIAAKDGSATWTGWCHGSAGHVLLWLAAAKAFNSAAYLDVACQAAQHLHTSNGRSGVTLCCGLAGEALALFALGRASGDEIWFTRGRALVRAASKAAADHANPHGLFRGAVGVHLASVEARDPARSTWPVCESPLA